ncbi:MAG: ATP-binding cassette domain-containing protein, partial [Rhodospirillales bacterium]
MLLNVEKIDVRYGRNHAVKNVSLNIADGEIVTVLGANGAGKSSLLKAIQGTEKLQSGSITYKNDN